MAATGKGSGRGAESGVRRAPGDREEQVTAVAAVMSAVLLASQETMPAAPQPREMVQCIPSLAPYYPTHKHLHPHPHSCTHTHTHLSVHAAAGPLLVVPQVVIQLTAAAILPSLQALCATSRMKRWMAYIVVLFCELAKKTSSIHKKGFSAHPILPSPTLTNLSNKRCRDLKTTSQKLSTALDKVDVCIIHSATSKLPP